MKEAADTERGIASSYFSLVAVSFIVKGMITVSGFCLLLWKEENRFLDQSIFLSSSSLMNTQISLGPGL